MNEPDKTQTPAQAAQPKTSAADDSLERFRKQLAEEYLLIPKSKLWHFGGGAATTLLVLLGVSLGTLIATVRSKTEIKTLKTIVRQAEFLKAEAQEDAETIRDFRSQAELELSQMPGVPAKVAKLAEAINLRDRLEAVEDRLTTLTERRDSIRQKAQATVNSLPINKAQRKKLLSVQLKKAKGYSQLEDEIKAMNLEVEELRKKVSGSLS